MADNKEQLSKTLQKTFEPIALPLPDISNQRVDKIVSEAKEFYESDVTPRAKRERSNILYGIPQWSKWTQFKFGNMADRTYVHSPYADSYAYSQSPAPVNWKYIYLDPYASDNALANTVVQAQTVQDANRWHTDYVPTLFKRTPIPAIVGHLPPWDSDESFNKRLQLFYGITPDESNLLKVYGTQQKTNVLYDVKHQAENRGLRFEIWKRLKQQLGRVPTIEETDAYIQSLSEDELKSFQPTGIKKQNDYQIDQNLDQIKDALIHVAQNSTTSPTYLYAKRGGTINYLNCFN